jgi:hypothetical protein
MSNTSEFHKQLRENTARLLGYDIAAIPPAQEVRLKMCVSLRLEVDRLMVDQLAGRPIDTKMLVATSEALESALRRPAEHVAGNSKHGDARVRLRELLDGVMRASEEEKAARLADSMRREEEIQAAEAFAGQPQPEQVALPLRADGNVVQLAPPPAARSASPVRSNVEVPSAEKAAVMTPCVLASRYAEPEPQRGQRAQRPLGQPEGWSRGDEPWRNHVRPSYDGLMGPWSRHGR